MSFFQEREVSHSELDLLMYISKHQNRIEYILKGAGEKKGDERIWREYGSVCICVHMCVCEGRGCILNGSIYVLYISVLMLVSNSTDALKQPIVPVKGFCEAELYEADQVIKIESFIVLVKDHFSCKLQEPTLDKRFTEEYQTVH